MRRAHVGLALLALLAGCRDKAPRPSASTVPPVLPEPLAEARPLPGIGDDAAVRAFIAALERAAADGDHDALRALLPASASLDDWLARQGPDRRLRAEVTPHMRVGTRRVSTVVLLARGGHAPRSTFDLVVASGDDPRADGLRTTVDASAPVARVSGDVLVDPRVPWLRADLQFELSAPTREPFSVTLPSSHVRINEITQDGQPCAFTMLRDLLVIAPADGSRPAKYRLRYESAAYSHDHRGQRGDATVLGVFAPAATIDLSVTHPVGTDVFAPLERTRVPTSASDVHMTRVTGRGRLAQVRLGPTQRLETATLRVPAGTITLEAPAAYLAEVSALLTESATAFAPLGPFPTAALRVTVADVLRPSQYEQGWILLSIGDLESYDGLTNEDGAISKRRRRYEVVAHELAHAWFPGAIPMVFGDNPRWWEAIANYLVTWAAPAPLAHGTRRKWLANLSEVPIHHERGGYAEASSDGSHDSTLSYSRAALVLAGLEAKVGRAAMGRWLRAVVDTRRDHPTDLMALIATIGPVLGQGAEDWTRRWLLAERGASFAVRDLDVDAEARRVRAVLVVSAPTDENTIQVAFVTRDQTRDCATPHDAHAVVVNGGTTAIDLPIPEDAGGLLVNADAALPLRHERETYFGELIYLDLESGGALPALMCTDRAP